MAGAAVGSVVIAGVVRRYRRDLAQARHRLAAVDRRVVDTRFGPVEYAERGAGKPVLVSHGILHGCDGGLLSVRTLIPDRRVIAPSRFGYLGSALPAAATPADQADAFAELLDRLDVERVDVVGISAGATAALQFALRHPDRVEHLVIVSGNLPGETAVAPPRWARLLYADPPMWALKTFRAPLLARLMGVPAGFPRGAEDAQFVAAMLDSIFPVGPRSAGTAFDAYVSNPDVNGYRLEDLRAPTLILHAADDPLASCSAAQRAAERIPGSTLITFESGGHLGLGQTDRSRSAIAAFLGSPPGAAPRVPAGRDAVPGAGPSTARE